MKNLILCSILFIATITNSDAAVRTVSNYLGGGGQYTNFSDAQNASSPGDTILIEGTTLNYPVPAFLKQLVIIGSGFNTDKERFFATKCTNIGGSFAIGVSAAASGTKVYGITFMSSIALSDFANLYFENCRFMGGVSWNVTLGENITASFINCIFGNENAGCLSISGGGLANVHMIGCVVNGYIEGNSNNSATTDINHCLFLNTSGYSLQNLKNASVSNSIFMNSASVGTNTTGEFYNNIGRLATATDLPPSGCTGSANLALTTPLFVTYPPGTFYSTSHDYDLQPASPGIQAGNDASDIGIHGGTSSFSETGEVLITPVVRSMILNNVNVAPGGTVNVQIQAGKPNDN